MKFSFLFKTSNHRQFTFRPRYYDADKEAFDEKVKYFKSVSSGELSESESIKRRVREQYRNKRGERKIFNSPRSNFRIVVIIALLTALSYWILS